jgi:glyoxylate reductase
MSKPKVYVTRPVGDAVLSQLAEVCEVDFWPEMTRCPETVLATKVAEVDGILGTNRWTGELMDKAPKLRIIANIGVGYDNVDVAAATQRGIVVTNTPEVLTDTTADLAFSLILASARRICEANRFVRDGQWKMLGGAAAFIGSDVHHATLGIVGMGRIGAAVAHRGLGFHMNVIYYDVVRREDLEQQFGYKFVDFDTLLAQSDFISMHMPLMEQTRHMMGQEQFAKMKPSAFFINAARGPVVDEQALYKALREGQIAGAGLDVFEVEPTPTDNPLLQLDNVVALPHIGSATGSCRQLMVELGARNLLAVVQGQPPLTPVNPEVLAQGK